MDALALLPLTFQTGKPGLAAGTTTTYSIATAFNFCINGKAFNKGTATNAATPTTDVNTGLAFPAIPANNGSIFVWMVDVNGNVKVAQGTINALDVSGLFTWSSPQFPQVPDGYCPFAYTVIKVGATGSAWTMGTSNLSGATGVTYTFQDVMQLPARPQVS